MNKHGDKDKFGADFKEISLGKYFNWPSGKIAGKWRKELAEHVRSYPTGRQAAQGIPFRLADGARRVILAAAGRKEVIIPLRGRANYICLVHEWRQLPKTIRREEPNEGLVVAEYELTYTDGSTHVQPIRGRFEVAMAESLGPAWLVLPFAKNKAIDPVTLQTPDNDERPDHSPGDPAGSEWRSTQRGIFVPPRNGLLVYAMANPNPDKTVRSLTIRGLLESPLLVAGLTLYRGRSHPLRYLPRRSYRVKIPGGGPAEIEQADVDLGVVTRIERTGHVRGKKWLQAPYAGLGNPSDRSGPSREPNTGAETLVQATGSEDATVSVKLAGKRKKLKFSLGDAFRSGSTAARDGSARLQVLGKRRQWMKVIVSDAATGKPTAVRIHFSDPRGRYIAPYGHHEQINPLWFQDYGADVVSGGRNFAYVDGEFTTDLPTGDLYVEICKGFEYAPVRRKVTIRPGQRELHLKITHTADWRSRGWVTADTHVHFLSPHTAALQAKGEGINIVNLLASQWGRLFTNVGDIRGRVNVIEDETFVYVGTENRNHMLGHMSMLGTQGLPVYPMCCGGPTESWLGDPDFLAMAEWAKQNRQQGGVVIRPHFPSCGHTEDPVPILAGLVDAIEFQSNARGETFPVQEWYRYLNCGYRVAAVGGTDKMRADVTLGWTRTYAMIDTGRQFDYDNWADAVRAGRTFATTGPLIDMTVDGLPIGETISLPQSGGTVEVAARAESVWPMGRIEIVHNGLVVADRSAASGAKSLRVSAKINATGPGWIAARCVGRENHPARPRPTSPASVSGFSTARLHSTCCRLSPAESNISRQSRRRSMKPRSSEWLNYTKKHNMN